MPSRLPSLLEPPLGFAHRGGRAHAKENTLDAFALALRLGATGLETDAWLTVDGEVVLDHDGVMRSGMRRQAFADVARESLPPHVPTLGELYDLLASQDDVEVPLSIDVKDPSATAAIVATTRAHGARPDRLYLCSASWEAAAAAAGDGVNTVHSTRLRKMSDGPERHAARLADAGITAVNMPYPDWNGGLTTLFHRFGLLAFGWDAQHSRQLDELLDMGLDAVYSDHADRLADALARRG